ncbi:ABC transporter substrate-binding protein, partial [Salmonella enterica subsp. enterica]|nr:ABC transporter substrate-binding protein [Salmonella enterica subsp. enterica serovar Bareilly]
VNVLGSLGIVPASRYDEKTFAREPIGAGPYRLVSFQPGQQLIVEANPWYAGKKNDFNRLVFVFLDEDNAYAAARSGQLGLVRIAPSM